MMTTRPTNDHDATPAAEQRPALDERQLVVASELSTSQLRAAEVSDELLVELLEGSWLGTLPYARTVAVPADRIVRDSFGSEGGPS
jgi:hypothetical protein